MSISDKVAFSEICYFFQEKKPFEAIDLLRIPVQDQLKEDLDSSINKLKDILQDDNATNSTSASISQPVEDQNVTVESSKSDETVSAEIQKVTESDSDSAPTKKKKKRRKKKKKVEEEVAAELVQPEVSAVETVAPIVQTVVEPEHIETGAKEEIVAESSVDLLEVPDEGALDSAAVPVAGHEVTDESVQTETADSSLTVPEVPDGSSQLEGAPISVIEDLTSVCPFEIPEIVLLEETAESEPPLQPAPEADASAGLIESVIETALESDPVKTPLEPVEKEPDEADLIMDALKSLDYEPVLSDTVLDLLVGKAANREKAVIATISRLENAMGSVVNEVQTALEHHNKTSVLVTLAKLNAQSVSEATSKEAAKELLDKLLQSSSDVREAFNKGEEINDRVTGAFKKLSEIADKAEQFDLKG